MLDVHFLPALELGLLFEISLCSDAIDFGQVTSVKHFTDYVVFNLFLLASLFLICIDHVENLHCRASCLLGVITTLLMVYVFLIVLLTMGAMRTLG